MWPVPQLGLAGIREAAAAAAVREAPETAAEAQAAAHGSGRSRPGPQAAARPAGGCCGCRAAGCALLLAVSSLLYSVYVAPSIGRRGPPRTDPDPAGVPEVHALNILRALFRDTHLGENIIPYVADGAKAAILGFTSPVWAKTIGKIATCLELQSAALQSTQSQEEFKLEDLKKLEPILKNILTYNKEFPFDVQPSPLRRILAPGEEEHLEFEEDEEEGGAGAGSPNSFPARVPGTLLPRLPSEPGMTLLTIRIEKIGLKDAGQCIDPYITVSVKDLNGIDLTPVQDTPVASRKEDTYVHFNVDIELQKHIEKLTKGAAIFFEFKHYKLTKRFTSTKCFAFMEMDEIKPGPTVIEL
ncbi:axin interactor, dorsalization-associated protein-like [Ictidomys tridecemlineatus]